MTKLNQQLLDKADLEKGMGIALRDIGIPPCPEILIQINQEMTKEQPDFSRLAKLLGKDVALAAAVIKITNSPFFNFSKRVRTVHEALLVLGLRLVVGTIAGLALTKAFEHVPDMERFWHASSSNALVSGWLVKQLQGLGGIRVEDAYTFGLFRDCGIPVLMAPFPEYRAILAKANEDTERAFTAVEDEFMQVNHAEIGGSLAEGWLLPEDVALAIRLHHDLARPGGPVGEAVPTIVWKLIAIAQLAEYLIQVHTGRDRTHEWQKVGDIVLGILAVSPDDLDALCQRCGPVLSGSESDTMYL